MKVTIIDVDQRFALETQAFSNYLTFELPSGQRFQVAVDDETVAHVIAESQGQSPAAVRRAIQASMPEREAPPRAPSDALAGNPFELADMSSEPRETPAGDWPERQVEHHVEEGVVEWETLPDTQLPPSIKNVMRSSGIAPRLTISEIDNLKRTISERLSTRPKTGAVDWNSGPRRRVESAPRRSIPQDEAGNPRPPEGIIEMAIEKDPGEVRDEEEDGIQQA